MKIDKITNWKDYISRLESFKNDERSNDKNLLFLIEDSRSFDKESLIKIYKNKDFFSEDLLYDKVLYSDFANNYIDSCMYRGNYQMFLHGDSSLFGKVVEDFKNNSLWKIRKGVDENRYQPFISEELGMFMQVENLDKFNFEKPLDFMDKHLFLGGEYGRVRIIFPGTRYDSFDVPRDRDTFCEKRNLANSVISVFDYLNKEKIPAHIYFEKYRIDGESGKSDELILYNPRNVEVEFFDKEIGYEKPVF